VELSAPAENFTPNEWRQLSEDLLGSIAKRAALRTVRPKKPASETP
jgi:hypothetical protein